jgi:hypothetical protein
VVAKVEATLAGRLIPAAVDGLWFKGDKTNWTQRASPRSIVKGRTKPRKHDSPETSSVFEEGSVFGETPIVFGRWGKKTAKTVSVWQNGTTGGGLEKMIETTSENKKSPEYAPHSSTPKTEKEETTISSLADKPTLSVPKCRRIPLTITNNGTPTS